MEPESRGRRTPPAERLQSSRARDSLSGSERWRRIEALFHHAVALEGDERAALLEAECREDLDLRARVERLLRGDAPAGDMFDRLEECACSAHADPMLGRTLGAYRVVARLAEGGMGIVYRAERTDGLFEREVAVKLIRAEHASENLVRRFELERRALAALDHPCIAHLLDGGTTDDGRPYLVMELVHGVAIDRYCEREKLAIAARLRLFVQVCRAVHCAHRNLIVHRDLKPSNILIDEQGRPKLVDFGIARLLEEEQGRAPAATRTLARILTPEYASPEQLAGGAVTTAIDVYSLGVILYEILTGRKPYRCSGRSTADWERMVKETVPARPSSVVTSPVTAPDGEGGTGGPSEIAARFASTPAALRRRLRGDLDRIVLMALRKEPERRYTSAQEFADDIERHLAGRPVLARGDSLRYSAAKFARRNRAAVVAASAVLVALFLGLVSARRSEVRAEAQAAHARIEAESFAGIADFLKETFLTATVAGDSARVSLAREQVLQQAESVRRQYPEQEHLRANLLDALGQVCVRLDLFDEAERLIREALAIRAQAFGMRSLEYALSLRSLGQLDYQRGDYPRAVDELREALELHRTCEPGTHTDVAALANDLAACLRNTGHADEAERLYLEALALRRRAGDRSLPVAESLNNLAGIHLDRGELERATRSLQEALEIRRAILGERHLLTLQTSSNLANVTWRLGQHAEARTLMQQAEAGFRDLKADGEEGLGSTLSSLAAMQITDGDFASAESYLQEALDLATRRLGPSHPRVAEILVKLAALQHARGRNAEARELWDEVLAILRSAAFSTRDLGETLFHYGAFLADTRAGAEAVPVLEESISNLRTLQPGDPHLLGLAELALGECLARTGQPADGREHLREAVRLLESSPQTPQAELLRARRGLEQVGSKSDG